MALFLRGLEGGKNDISRSGDHHPKIHAKSRFATARRKRGPVVHQAIVKLTPGGDQKTAL
jgi:hypothetical protein